MLRPDIACPIKDNEELHIIMAYYFGRALLVKYHLTQIQEEQDKVNIVRGLNKKKKDKSPTSRGTQFKAKRKMLVTTSGCNNKHIDGSGWTTKEGFKENNLSHKHKLGIRVKALEK